MLKKGVRRAVRRAAVEVLENRRLLAGHGFAFAGELTDGYAPSSKPAGVAAVDFGDGFMDIVTANVNGQISLFQTAGSEAFTVQRNEQAGGSGGALCWPTSTATARRTSSRGTAPRCWSCATGGTARSPRQSCTR